MDAQAGEGAPGRAGVEPGVNLALRVIVPEPFAEAVGAVLMETLGPFEEEVAGAGPADLGAETEQGTVALVFYPSVDAAPTDGEVLAALPLEVRASGLVRLERRAVSRDWVEGWRDHFRPITIGEIRIRPPWEPAVVDAPAVEGARPQDEAAPTDPLLVDVVINPGLGFGTGLHSTTRGTLRLLQYEPAQGERPARLRGPVVDAGTGSGILAIAAAKLGWGPVFAFDSDPEALKSARENIEANGVAGVVEVHRAEVSDTSPFWFAGATVLANMTLEPVLALVRKIAHDAPFLRGMVTDEWPERLVVSGILAGEQEQVLVSAAGAMGFVSGRRMYEDEWVSLELLPTRAGGAPDGGSPPAGSW
jgi:ribosomal protein L11 methyltransferase